MVRTVLNIRSLAIVGAFALAVMTAGCSSGDDDATTPAASSGAATSPQPSPSSSESDDDGGDGSASDDLVSWAGDFCDAVRPMVEKTQDLAPPTDASDPATFLTQYQALLADLGPTFETARDAVADLDAPPIDNGDDLKQQMITLLDESSTVFGQISDQIDKLDPSDPDALQSFGAAISSLAPDLEQSSEALDKAFSDPDMKDAFDQAPQCAGLDMGS